MYIAIPVLWFFGELVGKGVYSWVDNKWIFIPHSKNHPTLENTPIFWIWTTNMLQLVFQLPNDSDIYFSALGFRSLPYTNPKPYYCCTHLYCREELDGLLCVCVCAWAPCRFWSCLVAIMGLYWWLVVKVGIVLCTWLRGVLCFIIPSVSIKFQLSFSGCWREVVSKMCVWCGGIVQPFLCVQQGCSRNKCKLSRLPVLPTLWYWSTGC
jgi:hypothetical protein